MPLDPNADDNTWDELYGTPQKRDTFGNVGDLNEMINASGDVWQKHGYDTAGASANYGGSTGNYANEVARQQALADRERGQADMMWGQQGQSRMDQQQAIKMARDAALGLTPSVAAIQQKQGLDAAIRGTSAAAAGGRGAGGIAMAQYNAGQNAAALANTAVTNSSRLRAEEVNAARGQLGQFAQGLRSSDLAAATERGRMGRSYEDLLQGTQRAELGAQAGAAGSAIQEWEHQSNLDQKSNQMAAQNTAAAGGAVGDVATGIGKLSNNSDVRAKTSIQPEGSYGPPDTTPLRSSQRNAGIMSTVAMPKMSNREEQLYNHQKHYALENQARTNVNGMISREFGNGTNMQPAGAPQAVQARPAQAEGVPLSALEQYKADLASAMHARKTGGADPNAEPAKKEGVLDAIGGAFSKAASRFKQEESAPKTEEAAPVYQDPATNHIQMPEQVMYAEPPKSIQVPEQVIYGSSPVADRSWETHVQAPGDVPPGMVSMGGGPRLDSDEREKTNIDPQSAAPAQMMDRLQPYSYEYKQGMGLEPGRHYGIMAQDLESTPMGASAVMETPKGKAIDIKNATGLHFAAEANLNQRLRALEGRGGTRR